MKKIFKLTLLVGSFLYLLSSVNAASIAGMDLTYKCIGGNDYIVTLTLYNDCSGSVEPNSVQIQFQCSQNLQYNFSQTLNKKAGPNGIIVTNFCSAYNSACLGGTSYGIREWIYEGQATLLPCNFWKISHSLSARNLNNTTSTGMAYIESILDNLHAPCNSSPTFTTKPIVLICKESICLGQGAIDTDGDSLSYEWSIPMTSNTTTVYYAGGYSYTQPIASNPHVTLDPVTSDICMHPTINILSIMAVKIKEWRTINGTPTVIGTTIRDIQIKIVSCNNSLPVLSGIDTLLSHTYNPNDTVFIADIYAGSSYTFDINGYDSDTLDTLVSGHPEIMTISWNNGISAGNFTPYYNGTDSAYANFSWTPTSSDVSNIPKCFTATVQDSACPFNGFNTFSYCMIVKSGLSIEENQNQNNLIENLKIYPNPFKDELNIEYYLSISSNVKIELYNILGEQLKLIQDDDQNSGQHNLKLDSKKNNMTKGIYILKISSENFEINKKVIFN